jgi:hypothetical protein
MPSLPDGIPSLTPVAIGPLYNKGKRGHLGEILDTGINLINEKANI